MTVASDQLFSGDPYNVHDPSWPGMDWDLSVAADPDVNYLCSIERAGQVQVEIEQFALQPANHRPQVGDWVQVTGRWIFDCGHSEGGEHWTEIHPPEVVVSSHVVGEETHAYAVTTGAWLGTTLSFVVFPPPRPSATSKLQVSPEVGAHKHANFKAELWPPESPNHVVCTISPDTVNEAMAARVDLDQTGLVAMSRARFLRARIACSWVEQTASITIDPAGAGAHVFFRDPDNIFSGWTEVPQKEPLELGSPPLYELALLPKQYEFRGGGSGWDYAPEPVTLDPGANHVALHPKREDYVAPGGLFHLESNVVHAIPDPAAEDEWYYLRQAAIETLADALVLWTLPLPNLSANPPTVFSAAKTSALIIVALLSWVADDGTPVTDLDAVLSKPKKNATGAEYYVNIQSADGRGATKPFVSGRPGPPIAGAKLAVQLTLGNERVGRHAVAQAQLATNGEGFVAFSVGAGSHPEDVSLGLRVLENAVNPWFTPALSSPSLFFRPGAQSDLAASRTPYTLFAIANTQLASAGVDAQAIRVRLARTAQKGAYPTSIVRPLRIAPKP